MTRLELREMLVLWPAWLDLVAHVSTGDPRTADPQDIFGAACGSQHDRLAALLYAHHVGDTLDEATTVLDELLVMARDGRRPRYGREMGLDPAMFWPEAGS